VCHTVYVDRSDGSGLERLETSQTLASSIRDINQSRKLAEDTPLSSGVAVIGRTVPLERVSLITL
jgi:hypothetical protein